MSNIFKGGDYIKIEEKRGRDYIVVKILEVIKQGRHTVYRYERISSKDGDTIDGGRRIVDSTLTNTDDYYFIKISKEEAFIEWL